MSRIIGIDLGTTTSEIAYIENGEAKIIPDYFGNRIIPSVVGEKEDKSIVVGQVAYNQLISSPDRTVSEIKRLMGTDTKVSLGERKYLPHEISSMIISQLKLYAEDYLGEEVTEAVITVPANFNNSQRKVTKIAGEMAGLKVDRIINEPTAAAISYGIYNLEKEEKILVYDLGGGTFDVSILELFEGILDVKCSRGDEKLGGKDFDRRVEEYIEERFKQKYNVDLYKDLDIKIKASISLRIKEAALKAKKELSTSLTTNINIPFITVINNKPISIDFELTREEFDKLTKDLVEKTSEKIKEALEAANLKKEEIDKVLLVGGSSRIASVKRLVEDMFPKKVVSTINPDEAVAMGAAIQAGIKSNEMQEEDSLVITDKCNYNLGTSIIKIEKGTITDGVFDCIIPIDSSIPCSNKKTYYTAVDNQNEVRIEVYEGNEIMAEDNTKIGDFLLEGIPKAKAGNESIDVEFDYDLNGILNVKATIVSTQKSVSKIIDNFKLIKLPPDRLIDRSVYDKFRLDSWEEYELDDGILAIMEIAQDRLDDLKKGEEYDEINNILESLKSAAKKKDKNLIEEYDERLTNILFRY